MDIDKLITDVTAKFADALIEEPTSNDSRIVFPVNVDKLRDLATYLKHEYGFLLGNTAFGTDTKEEIVMQWYIGDPESAAIAILKTTTDRDTPVVPTLSDLWQGFGWNEREAYDLLGIKFEGNKDLRRIYLPDNWEGHPLRQDYVYKRPKYHKPEYEEAK